MGKRNSDGMEVGQDSFLDITANLVGILIILVVVIGTKTKLDAEEYGRKIQETETPQEIKSAAGRVRILRQQLGKQQSDLAEYNLEIKYRELERDRILQDVLLTRESVSSQMSGSDADKQQSIERTRQQERLEKELSDIEEQILLQEETERPKIVLEHLPTPMAKTVLNQELHLQLKNGLVTIVPWDQLLNALRSQVPLAMQRGNRASIIEEKLGPIGGFLMTFRLNAIPQGYDLENFDLQPTEGIISESITDAFSGAGRIRLELAGRNPEETVVTVWVYPDSFPEFRELKTKLFSQGFLTAARPLPEGVAIGASPQGTNDSTQ